ncbi:hypothetical protein AMIS_21350 [Actinoplanes missouriensis 431]|uniref:Uncharacterized protein n=1 Tax=Actinoplanes missouriensis (strain ATCC 14538 / DSM 43046 / CBS 188.64 / JCM 3121 / NBRC 102363 / NCIMB 12654 / NRRL B-3342 / UNCC 431) TaxID=512565 RepID=I0H2W8_ACTM4|nr:hypothetical protein [Actinoplanes missouriensis]BAL87355.1 hypothetical protein AMIS_21350 [Actinoplanes missouriensis 431]
MSTLQTVALAEWRVAFVMAAGQSRRMFLFTIPAVDEESALAGAHLIADGINEASGHVWKLTSEFSAEVQS